MAQLNAEGFQEATIKVKGRYSPDAIEVKLGIPVRINFCREEDIPCSERVILSGFHAGAQLPPFQTTSLTFVPTKCGEFLFTCAFGMYQGRLIVIEPGRRNLQRAPRAEASPPGRVVPMMLRNAGERLAAGHVRPRTLIVIFVVIVAMLGINMVFFGSWSIRSNVQSASSSPGQENATASLLAGGMSASAPPGSPAWTNVAQTSTGGAVTIQAVWSFERTTGTSIHFDVTMETHSVNLDNIDLSKLAVLRNSNGRQLAPTVWNAPSRGHHRAGELVFTSADGDPPIIDAATEYVELVISDVAGVPSRVLHWDIGAR